MKYKITCDIEKEIEAKDEDEAIKLFYDELGQENDTLENHTAIETLTEKEPKTIDGIKIEKTNEQVLSIRKTTEATFTLTDKKGREIELVINNYNQDDEIAGWDNDETITCDDIVIDDFNEWVENTLGEEVDADSLLDEMRDNITV